MMIIIITIIIELNDGHCGGVAAPPHYSAV